MRQPIPETRRHDHRRRFDPVTGGGFDADAAAVFQQEAGDLGPEPEFAAEPDDALPQVRGNGAQLVRTDVRTLQIADFRRRTRPDQRIQHESGADVAGAGIELAVRKCTGPAFPEQQVARFVEFAAFEKAPVVGVTLLDPAPAVEDQRLRPGQRQRQRGENTGGAGADHDRMQKRRPFRQVEAER